ncbi:MAG: GNAT family N-acetyltransferase [Gammaproteobacteria bacterium]|nr:GNAT family N-acetyltransferase [Gammaproteobacteria bacterium]MCH9744791.1 GNAT family N-acetyltransferase [Gammaproteobacteria bacterium]
MNKVTLRLTIPDDTKMVSQLMREHWGGEPLVIRSKNYYPSKLEGIIAYSGNEKLGFLFFDIQGKSCEIVVFEVFNKFHGLGTKILDKLKTVAKDKGCNRIYLMTTNDNLDALRFYQRRGFHISDIHLDSMKASRKMKPGIPLIGDHGIPIRDEIDLEIDLRKSI